ncbi:ribose-5-phosphate isomerase RpiA [Weissella muntiaci]|uniref:Ribose-5-phosphate isomerase A n=1 Tax=Weissella muntiaci TaxID=2508881 RepID=A0A6C2C6K4_9LACO|nr:ribose-5-phosphate isomerase RpiA [Weissella muntiaci]TYC49591.1 ribose-5-phosphate isomerase RpiA [Weissella muntiaci]
MDVTEQKRQVGKYAAGLVEDHMTVGLGTGSTVKFFVDALAERVNNEGLNIIGVTTSVRTAEQAQSLGIKIVDLDDVDEIDLTVDGADRVNKNLDGIKGGGAALLFEKIVAINSKKNVWIVDETKLADPLGGFPLPVEVVTYGVGHLNTLFANEGLKPVLRTDAAGETVVTDNGNYIIDLHLDTIEKPVELADWLSKQVGVIEHGLFINIANRVIVAGEEIKILDRAN